MKLFNAFKTLSGKYNLTFIDSLISKDLISSFFIFLAYSLAKSIKTKEILVCILYNSIFFVFLNSNYFEK